MNENQRRSRAKGAFVGLISAWGRRGSLLGLFGAVLGVGLCLLLIGCGASASLSRGPITGPNGPAATATAGAAATATEGAIPPLALPYMESAPGCGATASEWIVQSAEGVTCLTHPQRVHLMGEPYSSTFCCENEVELPFGPTARLSSTFRVTVDVSGLLGQLHTSDDTLIARLIVRLEPDKGLIGASPVLLAGFAVGGDGSVGYTLGLAGDDAADTFDAGSLTRPVTVAITVDAYTASVALNGVTYLQRPVTTPMTVAAIALQVVGPSGASVEFSNLKLEQVTGGVPIMS